MAIGLFTDSRMTEHAVPARHPERPERLIAVMRHLDRTRLIEGCDRRPSREASDAELELVHTADYIKRVSALERSGGGMLDPDTWVYPGTERAARLAAGCAIDAAGYVMAEPNRRAFVLARPPGHHALRGAGMGFCIFANISLCARAALDRHQVNRILIVDFDVHHGNGTQETFYTSGQVGFLSIHRHPFYPGTGMRDETGSGAGLGNIVNIPLPHGTPRRDFLAAFRLGLEKLAERIRPELILVSAGFDAHVEDPVGDLGLETEDFVALTQEVNHAADCYSDGRIVSLLEGGYNVPILAGAVAAHLETLGVKPQTP